MSKLKNILIQWLQAKNSMMFGQKVPNIVPLLLIATVIGFLGLRHTLTYGKWNTLQSLDYGYSIDYPAHWFTMEFGPNGEKAQKDLRAVIGELTIFDPLSVRILELPILEPTWEEALAWGQDYITSIDGYDLLPVETIVIGQGNYSAKSISYRRGRENEEVVLVLTPQNVLMIKFSTRVSDFDERRALFFQPMLESFLVLP